MLREREADVLAVWKLDRWARQGLSAVDDLVRALNAAPVVPRRRSRFVVACACSCGRSSRARRGRAGAPDWRPPRPADAPPPRRRLEAWGPLLDLFEGGLQL